jgi:hypothetical protein
MNAIKSRIEADKKKLSPSQEKMMMRTIKKQCAEYWKKHELELMALILWQLHANPKTRWGKKRLKQFFMDFTPLLDDLLNRYDMETDDEKFWLCTYKLKEIGVDLEEWQKEEIRR